jgi:hypothetical protein
MPHPSPNIPLHARKDSVQRRKERAAGKIAIGERQSEIARKLRVSIRSCACTIRCEMAEEPGQDQLSKHNGFRHLNALH